MDFFNISFKLSLREDREDFLGGSGDDNKQTAMWGPTSVISYVPYSKALTENFCLMGSHCSYFFLV